MDDTVALSLGILANEWRYQHLGRYSEVTYLSSGEADSHSQGVQNVAA